MEHHEICKNCFYCSKNDADHRVIECLMMGPISYDSLPLCSTVRAAGLNQRIDPMRIYADIQAERIRQYEKHGDQTDCSRYYMLAVLSEEVGEVARAMMENGKTSAEYRTELVHVAAVAVQMIEHFDGVPQIGNRMAEK